MQNKPLELLSPAKDKVCAISAINFGADAIYMGAPSFGARKAASNSIDDIKEVVEYAHKFFARVYIAINTIVDDDEIQKVQKLLYELYDVGVDGIIVQDFGIFELNLPPFLVSASTQCDIRDVDKVKFFENIGLNRVILARELSLEKIKEICKKTKIEVETFIHGALCVSYSGQCYLSCMYGGRSANRGECAQPCRKKYSLVNDSGKIYAKDKHLLSLKDFCAADYIEDLINAGVVSFKIEGRLKDKNYVKNVTAYYNLKLKDKKRISSGKVFYDFTPDVNKSFNRSFTSYFLNGKNSDIFSFDTPSCLGECLGKIDTVFDKGFKIKTKLKINPQDGLSCFEGSNLSGMLVNKVEITHGGVIIYPNRMPKLKKGQLVYRNFDSEFDKKLSDSKTKRRILAEVKIYNDKIEIIDEDDIKASVDIPFYEQAKDVEANKRTYIKQLTKCSDSDFCLSDVKFERNCNPPFMKISQINSLRRELLCELMKNRIKDYEEKRLSRGGVKITPSVYPVKNNDYRLNIHNKLAQEFYKKCSVVAQEKSYESQRKTGVELMRCKHCLRRAFNLCLKKGANSKENLFLVDEKGKKLKLEFDCKNCEMVIKEG